ncbi:MAG: imidazoleglycerol-phosphate dehydratase [Acidobacteriota bacterium]|jgi:imidazoleglycerol-phosphate dehydratase
MTDGIEITGRTARIERRTQETAVELELALERPADRVSSVRVPDGFFGHMLEAFATHGGFRIDLHAEGDVHVDLHHTVEDVGLALGEALREALGDRRGVVRFATAHAPLDEALARAVVDLSGRGHLVYTEPEELVGAWVTRSFPLTLVVDFFQALADRGRITLHLDVLRGRNPHHVAEAAFKAVAVALRSAVALRAPAGSGTAAGTVEIPSTKGTLSS